MINWFVMVAGKEEKEMDLRKIRRRSGFHQQTCKSILPNRN